MRKEIIVEYASRASRPVSAYEIAHYLQEKGYDEKLDSLRRVANISLNRAVEQGTLVRVKLRDPNTNRERNCFCSKVLAAKLGCSNSELKPQLPVESTGTTQLVNILAARYVAKIGAYEALRTEMKIMIHGLKALIDTDDSKEAVALRASPRYNDTTKSPLCRYSLIQAVGKLDNQRKGLNKNELFAR